MLRCRPKGGTDMKDTSTDHNYQIGVCGGGFAGISAALAAARLGKKVILFEKQYILGGLGTAGLVTIYLPLCDGLGHQVSFGIAEELFRLSIRYGAEDLYPANWLEGKGTRTERDRRFEVQYNPQLFAILVEQLLLENGIDILYGSYVVDADTEEGAIRCLYVENKTGRTAYYVDSVVDATGDCDIANFVGAPTEAFEQGNVPAAWYYTADPQGYHLHLVGASDIPDEERKEGEASTYVGRRFSGLTEEELTELVCLSHKTALAKWEEKRAKDPSTIMATIATIPQIRMTRKLVGEYELSHTEAHTYFEDSVGMVSNWKQRGPIYEVPFRTIYSRTVRNLFVAGRCTSVNQTLWDVMRVIPCCAVTGQAAGTAAALLIDKGGMDIRALQETLRAAGVKIHEWELNL